MEQKLFLKISSIEQVPDTHGNHFVIKRIGVYDSETGKWIKWGKLNKPMMEALLNGKIEYNANP